MLNISIDSAIPINKWDLRDIVVNLEIDCLKKILFRLPQIMHFHQCEFVDFVAEYTPSKYRTVSRLKIIEYTKLAFLFFQKKIDSLEEYKDIFQRLKDDLELLHLINIDCENVNRIYFLDRIKHAEARLKFSEILAHEYAIELMCEQEEKIKNLAQNQDIEEEILKKLGFQLTYGQKQAIDKIKSMQTTESGKTILLQGDVGTGKTLVALITTLRFRDGQIAVIAPTQLLAQQIYKFFCFALEDIKISVQLLTAKICAKEKKIILKSISLGETNIIIGTHSLLQKSVVFKDLKYIIVDEMHKFGVQQRRLIKKKGDNPYVLLMSATPIPRSLMLANRNCIKIVKIEGKRNDTKHIVTKQIAERNRNQLIDELKIRITKGEKIYWIAPTIQGKDEKYNVSTFFQELNFVFPGKVCCVFGTMTDEEKNKNMQDFSLGEKQILIATTIVEVGIDVKDATVIVIEDAGRYGLAQLHQLRGRVGRGTKQSYCILVCRDGRETAMAKTRLGILENSACGLNISTKDMLLRGTGDARKTRQSGTPKYFFVNPKKDMDIIVQAKKEALKPLNQEIKNIYMNIFLD